MMSQKELYPIFLCEDCGEKARLHIDPDKLICIECNPPKRLRSGSLEQFFQHPPNPVSCD